MFCVAQVDILSEGDYVNELFIVVAGFVERFSSMTLAEEKERGIM